MKNIREQFFELIKAQDIIRRVYALQSQGIINTYLRDTDRQLSKIINELGELLNKDD